MSNFIIERMSLNELQLAIDWATKEGWNPGLFDAKCFYAADPQGFFVGKLDGEPVAVGSAVVYSDNYAFCGLYMVSPKHRGKGYGLLLTKARLEYALNRTTGLYGVINMADKYSRLGYEIAHHIVRYASNNIFKFDINPNIINLSDISFHDLLEYDRRYFPALRPAFLQAWITQPESFALSYVEKEKIYGYGVIRKCHEGFKIGPLFAESAAIAEAIFEALVTKANNPPFYMDMPKANKNSEDWVLKYNLQPVFSTVSMYRNGMPDISVENIYGITTLELG